MRFLIDANLPRSAIGALTSRGHQVEFVRDIGLGAAPDAQIAERAIQTQAAILTETWILPTSGNIHLHGMRELSFYGFLITSPRQKWLPYWKDSLRSPASLTVSQGISP